MPTDGEDIWAERTRPARTCQVETPKGFGFDQKPAGTHDIARAPRRDRAPIVAGVATYSLSRARGLFCTRRRDRPHNREGPARRGLPDMLT